MDCMNRKQLIEDIAQYCDDNRDSVNHPSHYQGKHECIDEMRARLREELAEQIRRMVRKTVKKLNGIWII